MSSRCSAGHCVGNIDPSGNGYPCQFAQDASLLIGTVREQSISSFWNNEENGVPAAFRKKPVEPEGAYGTCAERKFRGVGCRVRECTCDRSLVSEDPVCPVGNAKPVMRWSMTS